MKTLICVLFLIASSFSAITVSNVHAASYNILVVQIDADTSLQDSIPDTTGWTVNDSTPLSIGRYSYLRDQSVDYTSGTRYLNYRSHNIYLKHVDSLKNDTTYNIVTPYGNTSIVFNDRVTFNESIKVNQVGYDSKSKKRYANFGVYAGDMKYQYIDTATMPIYDVIDTSTNEIAYTGTLTYWGPDTLTPDTSSGDSANEVAGSGEFVYRINLDSVPPGGPYVISIRGYGVSYDFGIGDAYSSDLLYTHARGLYHQRCGIALSPKYTAYTRNICHDSVALGTMETWGASTFITVAPGTDMSFIRGGYHDAGDFDRRPYHTIIPVILAGFYDAFSGHFKDSQFSLPESGNGIPDFLDELLWSGLVWEYLQVDSLNFPDSTAMWGAVMQGTETEAHPDYGIDRADWEKDGSGNTLKYGTFAVGKDVTAEACGVFAAESRFLAPYDSKRSIELLNKAINANTWLLANDTSTVESQYMYCTLQLYLATVTGDSATDYNNAYHVAFRDRANEYIVAGGVWPHQFKIGNISAEIQASHFISYLLSTATKDAALDSSLNAILKAETDIGGYMGWLPDSFPYAQGVTKFNAWGASTAQGRYAEGAAYMFKLSATDSAKQHYYDQVSEYANYSVGLNPLGQMFVTGIGDKQLNSPLQLDSYFKKFGLEPNSSYPRTAVGNVPGIVIYGATWGRSYADYQLEVSDKLYPIWDYDSGDPSTTVNNHMPGLRRWSDGWSLINSNEFTTWETIVWNVCMYAVLYDANQASLDAKHSSSALNIAVNSYLTGISDTSTFVTFDGNFVTDTVILSVKNISDSSLIIDTVLVNTGQSQYTVDVSSIADGTYFLYLNTLFAGTFTKDN